MSAIRARKEIGLLIGFVLITVMGGGQLAGASPGGSSIASYDGTSINLANGWEGAAVCAVTQGGNFCFATTSDYQTWLSSPGGQADVGFSPEINCSSALQLYSGTNYEGSELSLLDEGVWLNLSTYGFSDKTNSYKVGACEVSMTSAQNGGGTVYPGPMAAGTDAASMESGWSDRIQSAYIL
ncbi:MAG: hypothetical protein WA860_04085 [Acidimicrobiales bacterium]